MTTQQPTPFQFRLKSAFVFLSIACITFAAIGRFGVNGLLERVGVALTVAAAFSPLFDLYHWWKKNDTLK